MVIVENKEKFLQEYNAHDSIHVPIFKDKYKHSCENELSLLYIYLMNGNSYVLPFDHHEALPIGNIDLNNDRKKWIFNKKSYNQVLQLSNGFDVNLLYYLNTGKTLQFNDGETKAHRFFDLQFYRRKNINTIIPIYKHIEKCEYIKNELLKIIEKYEVDDIYSIYNNKVIPNLSHIECNGLHTENGRIYSEYNLFTATGRPSNRFGGVNFAALDKTDGSRKQFISRFGGKGALVEFDYDSYHPRLIANIIGYTFPEDISIHKYLGKQYGIDDYDESKSITFRLLYGGIPDEIADNIEFFEKVKKYIKNKWNEYKQGFSVKSDIYSRDIGKHFDMNANKLFNYLIQLNETECNMEMLSNLIPFVDKHKSKIILYNYDSVLIDFCLEDKLDFLVGVKEIMKFPVKIKYGMNYHEMKDITEKING